MFSAHSLLHVLLASVRPLQTPAEGDGEPDGAGGVLPAEEAEGGGGHQEERGPAEESPRGAEENPGEPNGLLPP